MSTPKIAKELKVSKSAVFGWVKNVEITQEQRNELFKNKNKNSNWRIGVDKHVQVCKDKRLLYQDLGKKEIKVDTWEHAAGCMLFWAEGAKNKNQLQFTNTDVNMLKFFVNFLKKFYNITNDQIALSFQYHDQDINELFDYWIKELEIEGCRKTKPYCKLNHTSKKNTKHKYGIVKLQLSNTELVNKIWGSIQAYLKFNEPNILK